jgi:hypothetical protein
VIYNRTLSIANTSTNAGAVLHLAAIEAKGNTQSRSHRSPVRSRAQALRSTLSFAAVLAVLAPGLGLITGCGNNYRPVVSAINPVGPAAQPQKFAVAISSTGTPANPSTGAPANPTPGLLTFVDFSGDTILITANVGVDPYYLILNGGTTTNSTASLGFTLNSDHTFTSFDIDTTLLTSQILQTTLLPGANPVAILPAGLSTYVTDPTLNLNQGNISQFTGTPLALRQQLAINPGFTPVYTVGIASAPRVYPISRSLTPGAPGQANTIESSSNTIDPTTIPLGVNPVYGVMTADAKRAFILNQGDGTASVINVQTNALDTVPTGATNPIALCVAPVCNNPATANPLWADFAPARNEMVVANAGDGVNPGWLSVVSIPLCSATAQVGNPNCDLNNPVDAIGFGTVVATVPVGVNPVMVGVLQDTTNSRAYVINSGNKDLPCAAPGAAVTATTTACTVSVINLNSNTVIATIPLPLSISTDAATPANNGHPNYIAVTSGTPTGKVYVVSPDSNFMTIIRTDTDAIDTTVALQGAGVAVRVTQP